MDTTTAVSKRGSNDAALAAARDGWATTIRYVLILALSRGVPLFMFLSSLNLAREIV